MSKQTKVSTFERVIDVSLSFFDMICSILIESAKVGFGSLVVGFFVTLAILGDVQFSIEVALYAGRWATALALIFTTLSAIFIIVVQVRLNRQLDKLLKKGK